MDERIERAGLKVAPELVDFVENDLGRTDLWGPLAKLVEEFAPRIAAALAERDRMQAAIDTWHGAHGPGEPDAYREFLTELGYLLPEPAPGRIAPGEVAAEVATTAGPQLVVPGLNARYALNAANARWGSLYDALYGTDAVDAAPPAAGGYDPARGAEVIAYARAFLDEIAPLTTGTHADATGYTVDADGLLVGDTARLQDPALFAGHRGDPADPSAVLLRHHGLHLELAFDRTGTIGSTDPAGMQDIVVESAVTTIVDLEDSVAAVDGADKALGYRNWLHLQRGDLTAEVGKGSDTFVRRLAPDREYAAADGSALALPGRALLFVRHVGHHMTTPAVLGADGAEIPEGILDALLTVASVDGPAYVVKPKMHGPAEVQLTTDLFARVEQVLDREPNSVKLGLMDEERRTTLNLAASIAAAGERIVFVNTGFLDRSGDEIHTAMAAGPVVRKEDMKKARWIAEYERQNVSIALAAGFRGHGQIGKGMWAMPDLMADMLAQKGAQLAAGASTAWVPSPTAATLHALHYHRTDVDAVQQSIPDGAERDAAALLTLPLADPTGWTDDERARQVDTNAQSILGYVVRWIDQGIGCSKVPDIDDVELMEDRATLRISSQLLANWLRHDVVGEQQVRDSLARMAARVDAQNTGDPAYRPMATDPQGSLAFQAATDLIFGGAEQPNGYTEPTLHRYRRSAKQRG